MATTTTGTVRRAGLARLALALPTALLFGTLLAHGAAAEPVLSHYSIGDRVSEFKDVCEVGGGTFSSSVDGLTGSVDVTCDGGSLGGQHCTETVTTADCGDTARPGPTDGKGGHLTDGAGRLGDGSGDQPGTPVAGKHHHHHKGTHGK